MEEYGVFYHKRVKNLIANHRVRTGAILREILVSVLEATKKNNVC